MAFAMFDYQRYYTHIKWHCFQQFYLIKELEK